MGYEEICDAGCVAGAISGGFAGFVLGVWAAVAYVQPTLASIKGVGPVRASGYTAAIFLLGGIETFVTTGAFVGMIATPAVVGVGVGLIAAGTAVGEYYANRPGAGRFGFFERTRASNTPVQSQTVGESLSAVSPV